MRAYNIICRLANQNHLFKIWWDSCWLGEVTSPHWLCSLWDLSHGSETLPGLQTQQMAQPTTDTKAGSPCVLCSVPSISHYSVKCKVRLILMLYPWARKSEGSYEFKCIRYQLVVWYLPEESFLKTLCFKATVSFIAKSVLRLLQGYQNPRMLQSLI